MGNICIKNRGSRYFFIILAVLVYLPEPSPAQKNQRVYLSIFSESIALPFSRIDASPAGGSLGIRLKETRRSKTVSALELESGFIHKSRVQNSIYLISAYSYAFRFNALLLGASAGLGYIHSFYPGTVYDSNKGGGFEKISYGGKPGVFIEPSLLGSWELNSLLGLRLRYRYAIQWPSFSRTLPVTPLNLVEIGLFMNIKNEKN